MASYASTAPNHLDWPDLYNARDLGGTPTVDGGTVRRGALIRSDRHSALTDDGTAAVHAAGVSRIIDLRGTDECDQHPNPFCRTSLYLNLPVEDPVDAGQHDGMSLAQIYQFMLDQRPALFGDAIKAVAEAPPGAVAVHCAAGKDRTGIVVGLVLAIAGAEPEAIAADYALSQERLTEPSARYLERVTDPVMRQRMVELQTTKPDTMLAMLDHLTTTHGGVDEYLTVGGCTDDHFIAIRRRLTTG